MHGFSDAAEFADAGSSPSRALAMAAGAVHVALMAAFAITLTLLTFPYALLSADNALKVIRVWARLSLGALRILCGIRYRVEGAENIPSGPAVVAANHQSMWETVALFALLPLPSVVFKQDLLKVPFYGWWGVWSGSIPVNRAAGPQSIRLLIRETRDRIARGFQLVIFPEGTRVAPGVRAPMQPGVAAIYAAANVPVVPAVHDSGLFWRHPGFDRRAGVVTLRFLPPIAPGLDRNTFETRLEQAMLSARRDLAPEAMRGTS